VVATFFLIFLCIPILGDELRNKSEARMIIVNRNKSNFQRRIEENFPVGKVEITEKEFED